MQIKSLAMLANNLDKKGFFSEADRLDSIIKKLSAKSYGFTQDSDEIRSAYEDINNDLLGGNFWIEYLANKVAEKLDLHSPMFVGSGIVAKSYSVSNSEGQNLILKITVLDDLNPYYNLWRKSNEYNHSIMPKIYFVSSLESLNLDIEEDYQYFVNPLLLEYGIILMEELVPLDKNILSLIIGSTVNDSKSLDIFFNNRENFFKLLNDLTSSVYKVMDENDFDDKDKKSATDFILTQGEIFKKDSLSINRQYNTQYEEVNFNKKYAIRDKLKLFTDVIILYFERLLLRISNDKASDKLISLKRLINNIITEFKNNIRDILFGLPDYNSSKGNIQPKQKYIDALNDIISMGIMVSDLHEGNVMMRPDTEEIVIADIGSFTFN